MTNGYYMTMNEMKNWVVISSKSGFHELGYPIGQILCRFPADIPRVIEENGITNPVIKKYENIIGDKC